MRTSRLSHLLALRVFVVALAVVGTWIFVSGVVPTVPPGGTFQVADSLPATVGTALTVSPASSVVTGTPVTLSASVTRATAAGSVQFKDGPTNVGAPVRVSNGTASETTSTLAAGSHKLIAIFTPTDPVPVHPSTSPVTLLTVTTSPTGTRSEGKGSLPTITPQQSGLSLDNPVPVADNQVPVARDNRIPTTLDTQLPVAPGNLIPTILDSPMSTTQDKPVSMTNLDAKTATTQATLTPTTQHNRGDASWDGRGRFLSDRTLTGCRHSNCDSRSKCGPQKMTTSGGQRTGQSSMSQPSMSQPSMMGQSSMGQSSTSPTTGP